MQYIQKLILNEYLDSDSLKGIKIKEVNFPESIYQSNSEQSLKNFNIINMNKNTISNSSHIMNMIMSSAYEKLKESILYKKNIDPILEEIISNSIERVINYLILCKKEKIKTNLKIDEKKLINTNDVSLIMEYIKEIKKTEFKEAESVILNSVYQAIDYCKDYIKKPWKELEEKIEDKNQKMLYFYYIYKVIFPFYKKEYSGENIRSLIQKNYSLYEEKIMNGYYDRGNILPVYTYSKEIIGGRWIEFEKMVEDKIKSGKNFNESDTHDFFQYMLEIYPGRWKIAEPYFIEHKKGFNDLKFVEDYINKKVIPEYQKNINTFEDLEKYKDDIQMWDSILGKAIKIFVIPLYTIIKKRNLINYNDIEEKTKLFIEYFPKSFNDDFIFTSIIKFNNF